MQLQLHAWQALHLVSLLLSIKLQNDKDGARLSCAAVRTACAYTVNVVPYLSVCRYVPVSVGIAVKWVSNLGSWR